MVQVHMRSFWMPKAGNTIDEYEDAFSPGKRGDWEGDVLRFAVADGASEGFLCGQWARILVETYCSARSSKTKFGTILGRACKRWHGWQEAYLQEREEQSNPVRWYERPGLRKGAFSTFLGLTIANSKGELFTQWTAVAVGDSCMFHVHREELAISFPMKHHSEFSNQPCLICSNIERNGNISKSMLTTAGNCYENDCFYIMTDALAAWFIRRHEEGTEPWKMLDTFIGDEKWDFKEWIGELRASRQIRNDDATLVCIRILSVR